ncbi:porin [Taibaiella sp. KBW10]|uniref:type IX secretion/gliding motility protein PorT/SprT n=1 Tax=Taibaiella sp. KBW10 TaxID=2153357 RepID=UPI000F5AA77D|nr:outer membrane beta-barrel protein [Taibaiella sp. KBW10]RQO32104.1 porin [Taibaiella sp. KBW10]
MAPVSNKDYTSTMHINIRSITKRILKPALLAAAAIAALPYVNHAQGKVMNMEEHDSKLYYFGLTFGANASAFKIRNTDFFSTSDTFKVVQPKWGPGFHIGLMGTLRVSKFIDLRFVPAVVFAEKGIQTISKSNIIENKKIESIYGQLPLQLKFKSDRIHNFRFYGLLGGRFDYDMASNARSRRSDELLRVKPIDISAEVGFGIELFYPNFIFSPEIKIGQGLLNEHFPDNTIPLSNTIDRMNTRMITFSIQVQG